MRPKVLFVNPRYGGRDGLIILPLDQGSAVAYAEQAGVDVSVLDLAFEADDGPLEREVQSTAYDLVVLTCVTICYRTALEAARLIKRVAPSTPVSMMGEHVTYRREETLTRHQCIDYVISFEAEQTVPELARTLIEGGNLESVRGIAYRTQSSRPSLTARNSKGIVITRDRMPIENLDILPPPAKRKYALGGYLARDHETTMITTRGCTHQCHFCHRWRYGRKLRNWSLHRVMKEIEQNLDDGYSAIFFQDDVFCYDKERTEAFCRELMNRGLGLEWNCNVRVDDFDPKEPQHQALAQLMRKAGCYRIFVGIETFDQDLLDRSNKEAQISLVKEFVRFWRTRGIQVHASYIVGLPGDTNERIRERVQEAIALDTDLASFNRIFPHPGTPYGDSPEAWGITVPDPFWYEKTYWWERAVAGNETMTSEEVYAAQQWALQQYTQGTMS